MTQTQNRSLDVIVESLEVKNQSLDDVFQCSLEDVGSESPCQETTNVLWRIQGTTLIPTHTSVACPYLRTIGCAEVPLDPQV